MADAPRGRYGAVAEGRIVKQWQSGGTAAVVESVETRRLFSAPPLPVIPAATFNVTSYGAVGNGTTDNTAAIQAALNAANAAGGGTVTIPAGTFLSGPITLYSKINLNLASGAVLKAEPYGSSYYPVGQPTVSGTTKTADPRTYTNFITAESLNNIEISGTGTIDGQGAPWWAAFDNGDIANRPIMLYLHKCTTVDVEGVKLTSSPVAHLVFKDGVTNATVQGMTIATPVPSHNTDGIDVSGQHILINNCNISDGDDNIAIGGSVAFSSDITITNCTMGAGHGLSIGSITKAGINGLTVDNITFNGTDIGIRIKSARDRGGLVQNLSYSNLTMNAVKSAIYLTAYYPDSTIPSNPANDPAQAVTATTPIFKNITFTNVTATNCTSPGLIYGLPESLISNVTLTNVNISAPNATTGFKVYNARNIVWAGNSSITIKSGSTPQLGYNQTVVAGGWTDEDIGLPTVGGTSLYTPGVATWSNAGAGNDIGGAADQFNFASTPLAGNGTIVAKVTSQTNTNAASKAGVMIRSSNAATSAFAGVLVMPSNGIQFLWRNADGTTGSVTTPGIAAPVWTKLVRQGSTFTAFYSTNGTSWSPLGTAQTLTLSSTAMAGLAVTSKNTATASTAGFSNVSVAAAPVIASAVSRKTGTAGNLDLPLSLDSANPSTEARTGGANSIVFNFSSPVTATDGTLSANEFALTNGTFASATLSGATLTLKLTNVLDTKRLTIVLNGLADSVGNAVSGTNTLVVKDLVGDTGGDGVVNFDDFLTLQNAFGATTGTSGYQLLADFDGNGVIDFNDFLVLQNDFGHTLVA
jgi:polygalacturonase